MLILPTISYDRSKNEECTSSSDENDWNSKSSSTYQRPLEGYTYRSSTLSHPNTTQAKINVPELDSSTIRSDGIRFMCNSPVYVVGECVGVLRTGAAGVEGSKRRVAILVGVTGERGSFLDLKRRHQIIQRRSDRKGRRSSTSIALYCSFSWHLCACVCHRMKVKEMWVAPHSME